MRYSLLQTVPADTKLAKLFNDYLAGLRQLSQMMLPCGSMSEVQRAFAAERRHPHQDHSVGVQARGCFELIGLSNALSDLHRNVEAALELLTAFFDEYGGDLHAYAVANRRIMLEKNGSDDDTGWQPGPARTWRVAPKNDPASLRPYSLHEELGYFFAGSEYSEGFAGEYVGSSGPEDYATHTAVVASQTEFSAQLLLTVGFTPMR